MDAETGRLDFSWRTLALIAQRPLEFAHPKRVWRIADATLQVYPG